MRRAYAEATGRDPSTLSDDDLLAELDVAPTITVMNDDGMKQYVAATLNFKSGEIHTLVIDISEEEGAALELPAARAYEFAIAASSSNTAKASSCSVAPPICLGLAHKSRFTPVSNQVWSTAAEVPADKVAVVVQSLFPFTQETDLTASMNALGGPVAEIVESFKPAGTLPTPFEVTYYGGAVDDISYLSAFAGGQRSFVGYDGGAYRCLHFVPAINAQPAAE